MVFTLAVLLDQASIIQVDNIGIPTLGRVVNVQRLAVRFFSTEVRHFYMHVRTCGDILGSVRAH